MKKLDLTGKQFDSGVIVITAAGASPHGKTLWLCKCFCDKEFICLGSELKNGHTKSCGCYSRSGTFTTTHGHRSGAGAQTSLYTLWINMIQRCTNPNHPHFENYGGRGIMVEPAWIISFETFLVDIATSIGEKPPIVTGYKRYWSLDRVDNNGNYCIENIRWADPTTQKLNQRARRWWKRPNIEGAIL